MSYLDIDPQDIDPETGRPYANYSSPSLDTDFHDHELDIGGERRLNAERAKYRFQQEANGSWSVYEGEGYRRGAFRSREAAVAWLDGWTEAGGEFE